MQCYQLLKDTGDNYPHFTDEDTETDWSHVEWGVEQRWVACSAEPRAFSKSHLIPGISLWFTHVQKIYSVSHICNLKNYKRSKNSKKCKNLKYSKKIPLKR